jgi:hypothetical protein
LIQVEEGADFIGWRGDRVAGRLSLRACVLFTQVLGMGYAAGFARSAARASVQHDATSELLPDPVVDNLNANYYYFAKSRGAYDP